LREIQD
jgi:hypothetical protein